MPEVQDAVRGGPTAGGRVADRGRAEADAGAGPGGRGRRGPRPGAGARYRATGRPGRIETGAQAAGLAVCGPERGRGVRGGGHAGRDARAGEVVAARRRPVVVGRQSRAARRDAGGGRQR